MVKNLRPIFEPRSDRKMSIVALFSGGASAVPFMVGGSGYVVVGAISTNKNASGITKLEKLGIPVEVMDIHDFYGNKPLTDMKTREAYDEKLVSTINQKKWEPDIIACSGYMYILTKKFLNRFSNRILNVHPADLSIMEMGRRKYTGSHAVEDQIKASEKVTRSTIHIMDEKADHGPILFISDGLPVENRSPKEQQELMKEKCDGPAYRETLNMLSKGMFAIDPDKNIYVKNGSMWVKKF
jgi:folate-dependent phosphoribosylglycinamide formyltransferase PurN